MNAVSSPSPEPCWPANEAEEAALGLLRRRHPAIGGVVPFSSVDWPGQLAAVIFMAGCPWRCLYCHNPHLQRRGDRFQWDAVYKLLEQRRGLLDAVVFSGGEPLAEPCLAELIQQVKELGYLVGLHTAGIYPQRLAEVLPKLDWVGLDIKTNRAGYDDITSKPNSAIPVAASLELLLQSKQPFECRTTWSPDWLPEADLLDLAQYLAQRGVQNYVVQNYRRTPVSAALHQLSDNTQQQLGALFPQFTYR